MREKLSLFESFSKVEEDLRAEFCSDLIKKLRDAAKDYPSIKKILTLDVNDGIFGIELLTSNGTYSISKIVDRKRMELTIIRTGRKDKPNIAMESVFLTATINRRLDQPHFEYQRQLINGKERVLINNIPAVSRIEKFTQELIAFL